jgi:hypothetical protein
MQIEIFTKFWSEKARAAEKIGMSNNNTSPELRMAQEFETATKEADRRQTEMLKFVRAQKVKDKFVPVFGEEAKTLIPTYEAAIKREEEIRADIEKFLALTGGEATRIRLTDDINRHRRAISNAEVEVKNAIARETRRTGLSPVEVERQPAVQAAMDRSDRIKADLAPKLKALEARMSEINAILSKY